MAPVTLRSVLSALAAVAEATGIEEFSDAVLASATAVVGADSAVVTWVSPPDHIVRTWPDGFLPIEDQLAFERLIATEPWPLATHTRAGEGAPLRSSDLFSQRQYRRLALYGELFRMLEIDHQVAFSVPIDGERLVCVALDRRRHDFSDAELDHLELLRRPLSAAATRVARVSRMGVGPKSDPVPLTRRESDVLALVASGLGNDQVARRLGISARTVNKHLEHVYAKTGSTNRTQASTYWLLVERSGAKDRVSPNALAVLYAK